MLTAKSRLLPVTAVSYDEKSCLCSNTGLLALAHRDWQLQQPAHLQALPHWPWQRQHPLNCGILGVTRPALAALAVMAFELHRALQHCSSGTGSAAPPLPLRAIELHTRALAALAAVARLPPPVAAPRGRDRHVASPNRN